MSESALPKSTAQLEQRAKEVFQQTLTDLGKLEGRLAALASVLPDPPTVLVTLGEDQVLELASVYQPPTVLDAYLGAAEATLEHVGDAIRQVSDVAEVTQQMLLDAWRERRARERRAMAAELVQLHSRRLSKEPL